MPSISKEILVLEGLILFLPTYAAVASFVVYPWWEFLVGNDGFQASLIAVLVIGLSLLSAWRVFAWVVTDGPRKGKSISVVWWGLAWSAFALTAYSLLIEVIDMFWVRCWRMPAHELWLLGGFYVPPFMQALYEIRRQRKLTLRHKHTEL